MGISFFCNISRRVTVCARVSLPDPDTSWGAILHSQRRDSSLHFVCRGRKGEQFDHHVTQSCEVSMPTKRQSTRSTRKGLILRADCQDKAAHPSIDIRHA